MITGLLLVFAATMLLWIALRRTSWLMRAGRAFLGACAGAAQWWAPMATLDATADADLRSEPRPEPSPEPSPEPRSDRATRVEAALVARLYAGELTKADYHQAMADLAADDAILHPMPNPPLR